MPTVQLSIGTLHYRDRGEGPLLVLLHANPGDSRDFDPIVPELARRYRVLALDWPGYGLSQMPDAPGRASFLTFYEALREFVAALALAPALFVGNSVGGNAAARLAIEAPGCVRGLVLAAGGGFTPHNAITRAFCALQGSRFALSPKRFASLYLGRRTPAVLAMLERAAREQATPERVALNRAVWRSFTQPGHDLRARAAAIAAPTLLLYGRGDPALPARKDGREAARCIAHARLVELPCRHAAFAEIPERFLAEVLPFLEACVTGRAPLPAGAPALALQAP